jgi:hypothetical protein
VEASHYVKSEEVFGGLDYAAVAQRIRKLLKEMLNAKT